MRCPICDKKFSPDAENVAPPFCSVRCKQIDAKRWLCEEYSFETVDVDKLEKELAEFENAAAEDAERN